MLVCSFGMSGLLNGLFGLEVRFARLLCDSNARFGHVLRMCGLARLSKLHGVQWNEGYERRSTWHSSRTCCECGRIRGKDSFPSLMITLLGVAVLTGIYAGCRDAFPQHRSLFRRAGPARRQVLSTAGLSNGDIAALRKVNGVAKVQAERSQEVTFDLDGRKSATMQEIGTDGIDQPYLQEGRMPKKAGEIRGNQEIYSRFGQAYRQPPHRNPPNRLPPILPIRTIRTVRTARMKRTARTRRRASRPSSPSWAWCSIRRT